MQRRGLMLGSLGSALAVAAGHAHAQQTLRDITIPISSFSFATGGLRIAVALGLFAKNGLNAKVVAMDSANAATSALIAGSVDVVASGPGELVAAQSRGHPVVLIVDVYRGFGASLVLAKTAAAQTGVDPAAPAAQRIKALDGLIVASASVTSSYTVSFKGAADAVGAKIRFVYMAQPAMAAALENGAVQGMIASAPFWGVPVARGAGVLWLSGPKAELPADNMPASTESIQAMRPFAEANPKLMQQLIASIRDLGAMIVAKPDVVKAAAAKLYPDVDAATMDVLFAAEANNWNTRPMTPADMQHEIDFIRSGGASLPGLDRLDPAQLLYTPPA